jgi:ferredoxin
MSYKITDDCISCGACESECPNAAITEGDAIYEINVAKCTECVGAHETSQCADVCPVDACIPDPDNKESHDQLMEKWKKLHPGETPATS